jgi:hypothetical protein
MAEPKPIPKAPAYVWILPHLTALARTHGYALGLHGSMNRDLDLIAVPWVDDAQPADVLVEAIRAAVDGYMIADGTAAGRWDPEKSAFVPAVVRTPSHKPHGRLAWSIHFSGSAFYIDLSVMPRQAAASDLG